MCRPDLTFANSVADGRKCLTEQICPSPLAGVAGPGIIRPETNAPHWIQRAYINQSLLSVLKR